MPTALVTGATGFIGKKLCERLKQEGWCVIALAGRSVEDGPWDACFSVDLANSDSVSTLAEKLPPDVSAFFHLAGKAHDHTGRNIEAEYFRVNVQGTRHALSLAKKLGAHRFVLAGSVSSMGEVGTTFADESFQSVPTWAYGKSKLEAERSVLSFDKGLECVVLRFPMIYGGKDRGNMTRMVDAVRRHRFPPFPETGNRRSMVHVDDAVEAFLLAATHPAAPGGVYIVTDGKFYSTREIYLTIRRALGRKAPLFTPPLWFFKAAAKVGDLLGKLVGRRMPLDTDSLAKLTDSAAYSNARIVRELGFVPKKILEDGVSAILTELKKSP